MNDQQQSRADALTEAVTHTIETIKRQLDLIADRAPSNFLDKRSVVQSLTAHVRRLEKALAASPVEQPALLTAQDALAAIETFEIVGDNNDSREPNAEDRFILTEFVAHLFGGFRVELPAAAPASANETGAEGATWYDRWQAECTRDHGEYDENAPIADRLRWWVPKSARHGTILLEDDLREAADELSRSPAMAAEAQTDWRELSRRLYVELFHCDQQMRSTRDEDGEPHWTQSTAVRDVLADAKAALDLPIGTLGALFAIQRGFGAQAAMAAVAPADERAAGMPDEVRDSMMDSQYLAGVTAGWNAANADDPNAALKKIHDAYSGYLNPLRDWQKAGRPGAPATPATADERAECIAWANANGFPKYHESMCAAWEERARRAAASPAAEAVEAWINYPVITNGGEFAGYGEPELSFKRLAYGYDTSRAVRLIAAPQPAQADAPAVIDVGVDCLTRVRKLMTRFGIAADESIEGFSASIEDHLNRLVRVANAFLDKADAPAEAREPHFDDVAVDWFSAVMKHKLALARNKGRGGWETCSPADLSRMLREHVEKGDPRDVANFCMMLWHHGSPIVSAPADAGEVVGIVHRPARNGADFSVEWLRSPPGGAKLYTAPAASRMARLTDEQRESIKHAATWLARSEDLQNKAHAKRLCELLNGVDHDR